MKLKALLTVILLMLIARPVSAESNQQYSEFVNNYRLYQNLLSPFNVSRSKYFTYKSVIAQGEYLDSAKNLIVAEVASINSFTRFLIDYLNEANQTIGLSENIVLVKLIDLQSRINALSGRLDMIDSLDSAQIVMLETKSLYDEMYRLSFWAKSTIESAGVKKIYDNLGVVKPQIGDYLNSLPITYRENQAGIEKYRTLEKSYNTTADIIADSYSAQIGYDKDKSDAFSLEKEIHKKIQKATDALYSLVIGYQNILFAIRKN